MSLCFALFQTCIAMDDHETVRKPDVHDEISRVVVVVRDDDKAASASVASG
jgi:hypothetical protein